LINKPVREHLKLSDIMNGLKGSHALISLLSFFVGIAFLAAIILVDFYFGKTDYTLKGVLINHFKNPSYWLIYLTPMIFAITAWKISTNYQRSLEKAEIEKKAELTRINHVYGYVQSLLGSKSAESVVLDFKNDPLAKSLGLLSENIAKNKEDEILRRKEDEQRSWVSEGLAMFGEILRNNHDDINELSYNVISNLVKYTGSNQGAIFILNDDVEYNKYFEMTACYAYERRKFADEKIDFGEGLIGTCALEKQTIFLKEVPDSYLRITSGLGQANPKCLLLVPLNINEDNHGVIEIASFDEYSPYQVEFIEKIAESVASTISGVKINLRTAKLLKESREQAEIMASQEEEMRQNMEELQATQEEAARQSERFVSFSNSVNNTLIKAEYDLNGNLLSANENFIKKLAYSSFSEISGKNIKIFINPTDQEWFDSEWLKIVRVRERFEGVIKHITKAGKEIWMLATYTQVYGLQNELNNILFLGIDATEQKKELADFEEQLESVDKIIPRALFSIDGSILQINDVLSNTLDYQIDEILKKSIFDLISVEEKEGFQNTWESISVGKTYEGQLKFTSKIGKEKWLGVVFNDIRDLNGEISKISFMAHNLEKEKQLEDAVARQIEIAVEKEESIKQLKAELKSRPKIL
jgi:PAS domain S-box-containing protein